MGCLRGRYELLSVSSILLVEYCKGLVTVSVRDYEAWDEPSDTVTYRLADGQVQDELLLTQLQVDSSLTPTYFHTSS